MAEGNETKAPAEYPVSRLIEDSYRFFGVESHVAAGAFHEQSKDDTLSVDEAKKLLSDFAKRKVG